VCCSTIAFRGASDWRWSIATPPRLTSADGAGSKNGALLQAAEGDGFDVLVTADQNLRYQQNLTNRFIAIVELPTNSLPKLRPHFSDIADAVRRVQPGGYIAVTLR
jgi:hypothetical protein